ncbi:twin-arginine translocase TatA/TatE family subunit [Halobacterium sp. R2-5]|uniref:Sec-independent protein translocase subunit TatA/TatB n=1 Tax=Halobacterium sp. R2-5 TaxID=2715751 RepID=UPI0014226F1D|nr:twin-arginine translocase TatA/TatE family subunit [Halobacterium sp. R2-5]NIC00504.1 twin-arginine translocase TatA/TatE family subunit [Halobacterium sp. R2-5]
MDTLTPLFLGGLGGVELAIIAGVIILLFGAQKLPELARSSGKATGEFQKGRAEVEDELKEMTSPGESADTDSESDSGSGPRKAD